MAAADHVANVAGREMEAKKSNQPDVGTLRHPSDVNELSRGMVDINDKTQRRDMFFRGCSRTAPAGPALLLKVFGIDG